MEAILIYRIQTKHRLSWVVESCVERNRAALHGRMILQTIIVG